MDYEEKQKRTGDGASRPISAAGPSLAQLTEVSKIPKNIAAFESKECCPQCNTRFETAGHRAIQETCGHVKCRPCFIKNEDGCLECKAENLGGPGEGQGQVIYPRSQESSSTKSDSKDKDTAVILFEKQKTAKVKWVSKNKHLSNGIENNSTTKRKSDSIAGNAISYVCKLCDRSFPSKSYFEYHSRTHTGERPFQCSICDKSFISSYQLSRHMFCHNRESSSVCCYCDKKFVSKEALAVHVRHHTNDKPFACDKCEKKYPSQASLNRHILTHADSKDFLCNECGKTFMSRNTLSVHMQSHLRERNFPCFQCRARFKKQIDLDRHLLSHKVLKRQPCPIPQCKRRFRRKDNLIRHLKLTHDLTKEEASETLKSFDSTNSILCNSEAEGSSESDEKEIERPDVTIRYEAASVDVGQETADQVASNSIQNIQMPSAKFSDRDKTYENVETDNHEDNFCQEMYRVASVIENSASGNPTFNEVSSEPTTSQERKLHVNNATATSVIRSTESLDPRYQQSQHVYEVPSTSTVPYQNFTYQQPHHYYSTPPVSNIYETSGLRDDFGHFGLLDSSSNVDLLRNPQSIVLDNIAGSDLYLDVRYDQDPYRQYFIPEPTARIHVPLNQNEYVPRDYRIAQEIVIPDCSRSLIDLSFHNREVYSTYPDTIAVEQLNNQRLSPSSRYPRINFEEKQETSRPDNFSVIRRVSSSYSFGNAGKSNVEASNANESRLPEKSGGSTVIPSTPADDTPTATAFTNSREGRSTPSGPSSMNPSLNRDPRKNFLWENFNRMNRD